MDRFIATKKSLIYIIFRYLKSSMDRFIVYLELLKTLDDNKFKIQYG